MFCAYLPSVCGARTAHSRVNDCVYDFPMSSSGCLFTCACRARCIELLVVWVGALLGLDLCEGTYGLWHCLPDALLHASRGQHHPSRYVVS